MNTGFAITTPTMTNPNSGNSSRGVKVAMLVRNFSKSGGLELYAYKLIEGLLAHGLDITVICQGAQAQLEHPKLKVVQVSAHEAEANKAQQLEYYFKEFSAAINRLGPFDIIHSHHIGAAPVDVVTFHNHSVFRSQESGRFIEAEINKLKLLFRADYKMRQDMDERLTKSAAVLIFPSKICKQDYNKHFRLSRPESLVVAYPGWQLAEDTVAPDSQATKSQSEQTKSADSRHTILFVGRGYRKKDWIFCFPPAVFSKEKNALLNYS